MTRFYYRGDKRRDSLKSLFQTWHQILDSYDRKLDEDDDSLTWHIERTHIGILASAAYNRSRLVLEEYSTQKRKGRSRSKGRADLFVDLGNDRTYNFEAKKMDLSLRSHDMEEQIRAYLGRKGMQQTAMNDAACLNKNEAGRNILGIVFVIPYLSSVSEKREQQESFDKFLKLLRTIRVSLAVCHIREPRLTQSLYKRYVGWIRNKETKDGPYWEPGIAVVGDYSK